MLLLFFSKLRNHAIQLIYQLTENKQLINSKQDCPHNTRCNLNDAHIPLLSPENEKPH